LRDGSRYMVMTVAWLRSVAKRSAFIKLALRTRQPPVAFGQFHHLGIARCPSPCAALAAAITIRPSRAEILKIIRSYLRYVQHRFD
jgi:hypothetical protein